jgi:uncharacterized protein (TIRG00374 family)
LALKANKALFFVFKLTVSCIFLYLVFTKTGMEKVLHTLGQLSPYAFAASVMLYIFAQYISTLRWKCLLPGGFGTGKLFSLYMIGAFFNTLLPGIIGGDAVKAFYLYQATGKGSLTLASVFMDRYIGLFVLIVFGAIAYPFGYHYLADTIVAWLLPLVVTAFFAGSLLVFGMRLGKRIRLLSEFYNYFYAYRNQKEVIAKTLGFSIFVQVAGISSVYILGLGMGERIPFISFLIFMPLIVLFSTLPKSISGLGVREGAFVLFFGLIGVRPEVATVISLAWFLSMAVGGLIGLIEYIRYKHEDVHTDAPPQGEKGDKV